MPGQRSRQGCEECRKRRRKCDEAKPVCGPCVSFQRTCNYTLKLVWGARQAAREGAFSSPASRLKLGSRGPLPPFDTNATFAINSGSHEHRGGARHVGRNEPTSSLPPPFSPSSPLVTTAVTGNKTKRENLLLPDDSGGIGVAGEDESSIVSHTALVLTSAPNAAPLCLLPNGVPLSPPYQRLLDYFAKDILASLSVHPSIHQDLCQGLVPTMLQSPYLLSAGLALSAAGLVSRGLSDVAGVGIVRVVDHLKSSGLALLRGALQRGVRRDSVLLATCLLWCLADVFAAGSRGGGRHCAATLPSTFESEPLPLPSSSSSSSEHSSSESWRIHLQGVKALLGGDRAFDAFVASAGSSRSAMRHLYLLYLSLQTLPYVPPAGSTAAHRRSQPSTPPPLAPLLLTHGGSSPELPMVSEASAAAPPLVSPPLTEGTHSIEPPQIDGFLGYSEELLEILQQIDHIAGMPPDDPAALHPTVQEQDPADLDRPSSTDKPLPTHDDDFSFVATPHLSGAARAAADVLLGKAQALIRRTDVAAASAKALPVTSIAAPALSAAAEREFALCHRSFQQAALLHLYRRLFRLPSGAAPVRRAAQQLRRHADQMAQGNPCSAWVAMAMPLFSVGCEACTTAEQGWARAALDALADSIGSMHVRAVRQALEDVWRLRARRGDIDGRLCAGQLLDELNYNIILF